MTCGALSSAIVVGEIQYWFNQFIRSTELNKYETPVPATIPEAYLDSSSFIRLLFDDNWAKTVNQYHYMYKDETRITYWPRIVVDRVMIYPSAAKYYISNVFGNDTAPINAFTLSGDVDVVLLNSLLKYRTTDSSSLLIVDTTADVLPILVDTTAGISTLTVNYDNLTRFSKLIYQYLSLITRQDYSRYNNTTIISLSTNLLESCYEAYVIEKMFQYVNGRPGYA